MKGNSVEASTGNMQEILSSSGDAIRVEVLITGDWSPVWHGWTCNWTLVRRGCARREISLRAIFPTESTRLTAMLVGDSRVRAKV